MTEVNAIYQAIPGTANEQQERADRFDQLEDCAAKAKGIITMTLNSNIALDVDDAKNALHAAVDYLEQIIEDIGALPH